MDREYEGIVYDLDGTIVTLVVDWRRVTRAVRGVYEDAGVDPPAGELWDLLEFAPESGLAQPVEETIAEFEKRGARRARRLPLAEELREQSRPTAICSLNCEAACRIALETHDLSDAVDAVVGRDTIDARKPDPEPVLEAVDRLAVRPSNALFVGDSDRDMLAAERAGVDFAWVE